jgi:hypothetical protein
MEARSHEKLFVFILKGNLVSAVSQRLKRIWENGHSTLIYEVYRAILTRVLPSWPMTALAIGVERVELT